MPSADPTYASDWDLTHLRAAIEAAGVGLWRWNVESDHIGLDRRAMELWDLAGATVTTFRELSAKIHPTDLDRVRAAFAATRAIVGGYEIDFRILSGDDIRWVSARGQGNDADIEHGVMRGIFLDVTRRKQAEESHQLLAGEMSHRVQNLLLVACGLARITSRSSETTEDMALDLTQRLMALGRAHDLVRPRGGRPVEAVLMGDLLAVLLQAYDEDDPASSRIRVSVPRMDLNEGAATTLALVIHELSTNSLKHGALSVPAGTLDLSCDAPDEEVVLVWAEHGGPTATQPAPGAGYGGDLIERSMMHQFGGGIAYEWAPEGLVVTLRMRRDRMAA
ncbi:sensor histidine kinase [Roseococcus suduntuyensis]|uniref:histidine kinase n=1 Tax=Roseococcus suduntuyensis TaxID=455361 RepID=A0A840AC94_9PROT|nr:sensor histidine kinase [Roseococcus suduntuyensis]MBB3897755.1 two-component sensor histidine kinase [Roseococcus suduntuyensis]